MSLFPIADYSAVAGLPAVVELPWFYWHPYPYSTISGALTDSGNPLVAGASAAAKEHVSTLKTGFCSF